MLTEKITNQRKQGVGGSEVAGILGLDEYSSPYKVWLEKTGRETIDVDNKYTQAGIILESAVAEFFQQRTNYRIIKASANQKNYCHPKYEFARVTPDRLYFGKAVVGKGYLECKTTQNTYEDIPEKWFTQLQWGLGVMGLMYGSLAWLERGIDFKYKEYEYDSEFFQYMLEAVAKFWKDHVEKDIPPDPINVEDVKLMYPRHRQGATIQATSDVIGMYEELINIRGAIKDLEEKKLALENSVKMIMLDNEAITDGIKPLFTWKASKGMMVFDRESFRKDYPVLYDNYVKESEGSRRFLIKGE